MKKFACLILLFLSAQSFAIAYTQVGTPVSGQAFNSLGSTVAASAFNLAAGNQVFVSIFGYDNSFSVSSVTDTAGNTYVLVDSVTDGNTGQTYIYYCTNAIANASDVVTATWGGSIPYRYIIVDQWSGGLTSGAKDSSSNKSTGAGASTSSVTSNPFTSTTTGELIYVAALVNGQGNTYVAGSGYTISLTEPVNQQLTTEYQIASGITTASISVASGSFKWNIVAGTFKPAPAPTGSTYIINNAVVNNMVLN